MKILFLDIDEVLSTMQSKFASRTQDEIEQLCPTALRLLDQVCRASHARVVISSSWRKDAPERAEPAWWNTLFAALGCPHVEVVGTTPSLGGFRGDEVQAWLDAQPEPVEAYVALDDGADFHAHQPLVRTEAIYGFRLNHALQILRVLAPDSEMFLRWGPMLDPSSGELHLLGPAKGQATS